MHRLSACLLVTFAVLQAQEPAVQVVAPPAGGSGWGLEPVEDGGPTRGTVCLNGLWRFLPDKGAAKDPTADTWGWIRVPGAWAVRGARLPGVVVAGSGAAWNGLTTDANGKEWNGVTRGWYERELTIPAGWAGRRIVLELERVSVGASAWLDGQPVGEVTWPGGMLDLTAAAHPGAPATLRLLVTASEGGDEVTEHTGAAADQTFTKRTTLTTRGVIGDVLLRSEPRAGRIEEVAIRTSTRKQRIDLDLVLSGMSGALQAQARMLAGDGKAEKEFSGALSCDASGHATIGWDWADARRWDLGHPELYTLELSVTGSGAKDTRRERFGFREVWIDGRDFYLNGTVCHPRPGVLQTGFDKRICTAEGIDAAIDGLRATGFDCQELWPWSQSERGVPAWHGLWYSRAAEKGWGIFAPLLPAADADNAAAVQAWTAGVTAQIRRWRNNPAILGWVHTPNQFGTRTDEDPRVIGNRVALLASVGDGKIASGVKAQEIIHQLDPTRPATAHQGGPVGDIQAVNFYPCLQQTQEVEEWLSQYLATGDEPFWPVEFGPFYLDYRRGRIAGGWGRPQGTIFTELLATEYFAATFGREAYRQETADVRALNPGHFEQGERYRDIYKTWLTPLAEQHQGQQIERIVRAWRAMGASMLPIPWELELGWDRKRTANGGSADAAVPAAAFVPGQRGTWLPDLPANERYWLKPEGSTRGPRGDAIARAYAPTLAFIGGAERAGDAAALTAKDHAFVAGGELTKQAILINDSRASAEWHTQWTLKVGDAVVKGTEESGTIATGSVLHKPYAVRLPAITAPTAGELTLVARIGVQTTTDRLAIRVFPAAAPLALSVRVIDPVGDSTALLKRLGCQIGEQDPQALLVVGRHALERGATTVAALAEQARQGARILVMAQDPEWLRTTLGWRVGHQVVRRVFAVDAAHPLLAGLVDDDLADWAGAGSLIAAQPAVAQVGRSYPRYGWHWGNRGSISSAMIEKPHRSAWRPLLEGDFDLAYTPLMELGLGAGRIVWSTLDLEGRDALDPAADALTLNLLRYAGSPAGGRGAGCAVSGAATTLLNAVGVTPVTGNTAAGNAANVLVLGAGGDRTQAEALLARGGTVLCTAPEVLGLKTTDLKDGSGSPAVPAWAWCRGLSPSDLRLRCPAPQRVLDPAAPGFTIAANGLLAEKQVGTGHLLICLLDPAALPADQLTYLRLSRWRREHAVALILANLGAGFATDAFPKDGWYHPDWNNDQGQGDDPHRYYRW